MSLVAVLSRVVLSSAVLSSSNRSSHRHRAAQKGADGHGSAIRRGNGDGRVRGMGASNSSSSSGIGMNSRGGGLGMGTSFDQPGSSGPDRGQQRLSRGGRSLGSADGPLTSLGQLSLSPEFKRSYYSQWEA